MQDYADYYDTYRTHTDATLITLEREAGTHGGGMNTVLRGQLPLPLLLLALMLFC